MVWEFLDPERCVVGTVGPPGERVFLVQARSGPELVTVQVDKRVVVMLAHRIGTIIQQLQELGHYDPLEIPLDDAPLDAPVRIDFRAAATGLAWEPNHRAILLEFFSSEQFMHEDAQEQAGDEHDAGMLQLLLRPAMASAFVERGLALAESGRPQCPFCAQPINPGGHICPRSNGYRGPLF